MAWDGAAELWGRSAGDLSVDSQWRLLPEGVFACPGCPCAFALAGKGPPCPPPGACPLQQPGERGYKPPTPTPALAPAQAQAWARLPPSGRVLLERRGARV